jgi:hypothetical protein
MRFRSICVVPPAIGNMRASRTIRSTGQPRDRSVLDDLVCSPPQ